MSELVEFARGPQKRWLIDREANVYSETYANKVLRPMKPVPNSHGQYRIKLQGKWRQIAHIMLEKFVGPRPEGHEALHCNGDNSNNSVENLRWGTHSENENDKIAHGTAYKTTWEQAQEIKRLYAAGGESQRSLAKKYGVTKPTIAHILHGRTHRDRDNPTEQPLTKELPCSPVSK
jgi:DNA-binding XRE family transcriptional regulator